MTRLNLLPPDIKTSIEYSKKNASIANLFTKLVACFVALITFIGVIGYTVYENQQVAKEERGAAESQHASWNNTEKDAKDFADRLNLVDKIQSDKIDWQLVFSELASSTPPNVKLSSYDFTDNSKSRVSLTGFALSNTDIGTFRELLSKAKLFQYVDIENVAAATDPVTGANVLSFKITLSLNQTEAKK
jgi:Tfp pilus assembly protein PilN